MYERRHSDSGNISHEREPKTGAKVIEFAQRSYNRAAGFVSDAGSRIGEEFTPREDAVLWKGCVAGLIAGLAGTAAMTAFQLGWSKAQSEIERIRSDEQSSSSEQQSSEQGDSSTVKVANAVSKTVLQRPLQQQDKEKASYIVHFAFGTLMGGIYGISSEYLPAARLGHGLLHGIALWGGADALAVPSLGLSSPVTERSAGELAYELLAHAVYGVASESVREVVRDWID